MFINLTKAFDSINRTGLWSLLTKFGCPSKLINIIKQLHDGMMGSLCRWKGVWWFWSHGRRQAGMRNRTIAPQFIFCCNAKGSHGGHATGSIFNLSGLKASTKVTEALIRELLFADDCMMSCHTQPDLQHMTTKFTNAAKNYGLQIWISIAEPMSWTSLLRANLMLSHLSQLITCNCLSRSNSDISAVMCCQMMPRWMKISRL